MARRPAARAGRGLLLWPAGLFLTALLLRLAHLFSIRSSPFFTHLALDPLAYDEWALRILGGDWLGSRAFYQDPLYPYLLAGLYAILGHDYLAVAAAQCVAGALIPVLVFAAARPWIGHGAAAAAGVMAATFQPSIFFEAMIEKTWLGTWLAAAALATLSAALLRRTWLWWGLTGLLLGLGCLVRANLLLVGMGIAIWAPFDPPVGGEAPATAREGRAGGGPRAGATWRGAAVGLRQRVRQGASGALALAAGLALILVPVATRNRLVGGEWILTTSQGGQNFYIGNNPVNTTGRYDPLPFVGANPKHEERGFAEEARRRSGREMTAAEISRFWMGEALAWMRTHPADWAALMWIKARNYWSAYEVPDNLDYYLVREQSFVLLLPLPGFGLVGSLGLAGAVLALRRRGWPRGLVVFTAIYSASVIAFFVFARYRAPMMPAVFPLAGLALVEGGVRLRQLGAGQAAPGVRYAVLLAACWIGVNLPVRAPEGHWASRVAGALRAPRIIESTATAHYNLGLSYAARADGEARPEVFLALAVGEFQQATIQDPGRPEPWGELAKVLARLERTPEAIAALEQSIALDPDRARPHHVLGILHRRMGDLEAAGASFRHALRLDPERLDSWMALGGVLLASGDRAGAQEAYGRALRLAPGNPEAAAGLAASQS